MLYRRIEDYGYYCTAVVVGCCGCSPERLATFTTFKNAHDFYEFHDFYDFYDFWAKACVFGMGHLKKDNIFTIFCANIARLHIFTVKIW